jgi:hypothetical protein
MRRLSWLWFGLVLSSASARAEPCKDVALCLADEHRSIDEKVAAVAQARTEVKSMKDEERAKLESIIRWAAIEDAEPLRKAIGDAMVEMGMISAAAQKVIPTRKVVEEKLVELFTKKIHEHRDMRASDCRIDDEKSEPSPGTLRISCESLLGCTSSCGARYGTASLLVGPRGWKLEKGAIRMRPSNGGDCGDCL